MTTTPVPLHRLQAGVKAWIGSKLTNATVLWANEEFPRQASAPLVVTAQLLSGLTSAPEGGVSWRPATVPMQVTFTISNASEGEGVLLGFSGLVFDYTATAGQDSEDVRDALLAAIQASPLHAVTATAVSTDQLRLVAASAGDLYNVSSASSGDAEVTISTDTTQSVHVQTAEITAQIQLQARSTSKHLRFGAMAALAELMASSRTLSAQSVLDSHGISLQGPTGQAIDLTSMSGPNFETRAAINLAFSIHTIYAEAVGPIVTTTVTEEYRYA